MFLLSRFSYAKRITLLALLASLTAGGISVATAQLGNQIQPIIGETYFTKYNFWVEKERHITTNYSRGELIPINTRVTLQSIGKKKMVLDVDGRIITFVNARKRTQRSLDEIASELLSPRQINLANVSSKIRGDLESGILRLGMTKEEAIMTRGYPPRHKTRTTKANTWIYWSSRFVQRTIVFENGRIARGRGLY